MSDDWQIEEGVRCVVAPCCGFTFDASHVDDVPGGGYSCPSCEADALRAENKKWAELWAESHRTTKRWLEELRKANSPQEVES